jgi:hypothetical protein
MVLLSSCSLQGKMNKAAHLLEDHGKLVLDSNSLPKICNDQFPCLTIETETKDTSWITKDSANKLIQTAIKEATKNLRKDTIKITDFASCLKAAEEYRRKIQDAADRIDELADQIKESETIYNKRLEKQTVESTAKLKIIENDLKKAIDNLTIAQAVIAAKDKQLTTANSRITKYQADEKDIMYILLLLWNWVKLYLIIAAALFLIWKFRKSIPYLKYLPI